MIDNSLLGEKEQEICEEITKDIKEMEEKGKMDKITQAKLYGLLLGAKLSGGNKDA